MSALYGRLTGDRAKTQATRQANESIHAAVENWGGVLVTALESDGQFRVSTRAKKAPIQDAILLGRGTITNAGVLWTPNLDASGYTIWDERTQPTNES